jgi:LmbE family N-acetylglucosaminyl deacetylase
MLKATRCFFAVVVFSLAMGVSISAIAAGKTILVVAPHGGDETIACAGVIRNAVDGGDDVRIMMVTTGGIGDVPRERLKQTIAAMDLLGVAKEKIIYLGYEEMFVLMCAYNNRAFPDELCPGTQEEQTFAPEELITNFHTLRHGQPAPYTRRSILGDLQEVINALRPDDIYMPAHMELDNDHAASALFVTEALIRIKQHARYSPNVHEYMIHRPGLPQQSLNALEPVSNQTADMDATPYAWSEREAIPVPTSMFASLDSGVNLKHAAFWRYLGVVEGYSRFIKSDEIFWRKSMSSVSYEALVVASSAMPEHPAHNVIDGVAMGTPFATYQQTATNSHDFGVHEWIANESSCGGAYVQLFWERPVFASQVVLYDRPSLENQITSGEITFGDGSKISVSALPNQGSPLVLKFPPRWVTWLRFTVGSFVGDAPGLSELEVYEPRPAHLMNAVNHTASQPPPTPPVCRNCTLRIESTTATSITVTVIYPNSGRWGNRLVCADLTTGVLTDFGPQFEMRNGTYTITDLTPNNMYDIDLVYLDETQPLPWIDNMMTAGTLRE